MTHEIARHFKWQIDCVATLFIHILLSKTNLWPAFSAHFPLLVIPFQFSNMRAHHAHAVIASFLLTFYVIFLFCLAFYLFCAFVSALARSRNCDYTFKWNGTSHRLVSLIRHQINCRTSRMQAPRLAQTERESERRRLRWHHVKKAKVNFLIHWRWHFPLTTPFDWFCFATILSSLCGTSFVVGRLLWFLVNGGAWCTCCDVRIHFTHWIS